MASIILSVFIFISLHRFIFLSTHIVLSLDIYAIHLLFRPWPGLLTESCR